MMPKRLSMLCLISLIGLGTLTCADTTDLLSPVDPQFAKGGESGKPTGEPREEPVLQEFWVVPGATVNDPDVLLVVWSGGGTAVNPSVVWDGYFDGIRDDDAPVDGHYEWYEPGPPRTEGHQLENGWYHVDIPWDGRRENEGGYPYPDYLATEVGAEGDPYAFTLNFYDGPEKRVGGTIPFGVVIEGNNTFGEIGPEATTPFSVVPPELESHATEVPVRSFATFKGETPEGTFSITALTLSSVKCNIRTVTTGKGKNKVSTQEALVSGDISASFIKIPDITLEHGDYIWWEGHFLDEGTGAMSTRFVGDGSQSSSLSLRMPPDWTGGTIRFVIDYVVSGAATGPTAPADHLRFSNYVYDPGANLVPTTAGWSVSLPWNDYGPISAPNDGYSPVAHLS